MTLTPEKKWAIKQMLFADVLKELDAHFTKIGVEWMPIKGAYLIMAGLAEKIPAREMIDIDILVREKDYERVYRYLGNLPGKHLAPTSWPLDRSAYDYELAIDGTWGSVPCTVEIHRALGYPYQFKISNAFLFRHSIAQGEYCRMPIPETALAIALCHQIVNSAHRANPTLLDDIATIAAMPGFSWDTFWKMVHSSGDAASFKCILTTYDHNASGAICRCTGLRGAYFNALNNVLSVNRLYSFPLPMRRLLLELPVVANPGALLQNGIARLAKRLLAKKIPDAGI